MATVLTQPSTSPGVQPGPGLTQQWATNELGRSVELRVYEKPKKTAVYVPCCPVIPVAPQERAAFQLTVRLKDSPEARCREIPASLIEGGLCTISLTLDLDLPSPYVPQFARKTEFSIHYDGRCLASNSTAGAGGTVSLSFAADPEVVVDILHAISSGSSRTTIVTSLDLRSTGSPSDSLKWVNRLEEILGKLPGASQLVILLAPNKENTGYDKVNRLVREVRSRAPVESERLPVWASSRQLVPLRTGVVPKPAVAANAHMLLATAVAQPALTNVHTALLHDVTLVATPVATGEHLPLVENAAGTVFPDTLDKQSYWYPLTFRILPVHANDPVESSSFGFLFRRTGMTGGVSPRPTLEGSVHISTSAEISDESTLALSNAGAAGSQALPMDGLSAILEIPYTDTGVVKTQSLRAEVEHQGSAYKFTIDLLDDAVRTAYGSLAYPHSFQSQPARLRIAYTYRAYVPVPPDWAEIAFGGKIAMTPAAVALRLSRDAMGLNAVRIGIRPALAVAPQILASARKVRYAIRSVAREQVFDLRFSCTELGPLYVDETTQPPVPVGCTDVLKLGEFKIKSYDEVTDLRTDRYRVYRALSQPGTFLIVPSTYNITRFAPKDGDDKAYRPAAIMYAIVDPDSTKSKFYFLATLQPDIPLDARIALETALVNRSPAGSNPRIEYPTELAYATSPEFSWALPQGVDKPVTQIFPDSFSVSVTTGMDDALLLINLLEKSGINGSVVFTLEDGTTVQANLLLDTEIVGPWEGGPVSIQINGSSVRLTNEIERPINIFDLHAKSGEKIESVPANQTLVPGASTDVATSAVVDQAYCSYSIQHGDMKLQELRIFVEDVSTNVIFVNQVNLANHGLIGLKVQARLKGEDHVYTLDDVSGPSTPLLLTLPITTYLSAQILEYQIIKVDSDGSTSTTEWKETDLSKGNVVSLTWEAIQQ